ncbi:unnamed protein product [Musa hybrid cultivar]
MRNQLLLISSFTLLSLVSVFAHSLATPRSTMEVGSSFSVEDEKATTLITSLDGTFSCGFHAVGINAYCFSIWFTYSKDATVVWSANRDTPVNGRGSRVSLRRDGKLVLSDVDGSTVWDTNTSSVGVSSAELLNSGNLVLKDRDGRIHWQSFASPTHTLLPSQQLTKVKRLVSPVAKDDPRSGYYSLYFDNDNVLKLIYDGPEISSIYWPSPDYTVFGNGRSSYNSSRIAVLDATGRFLSSDNLNFNASDLGLGIKRRLTVDYDGNLRLYSLNRSNGLWSVSWVALRQICSVHGLCGKNAICEYLPSVSQCSCPPGYEMNDPRDWNKGCKPKFNMTCGHYTKHQLHFIELTGADFYGFDMSTYTTLISFQACRRLCMSTCSCLAFGYQKSGENAIGSCYPKSTLFNGYRSTSFPSSIFLKVPKSVKSSSGFNQSGLACNPVNSSVVLGSSKMYGNNGGNTKWVYLYAFAAALGAVELVFILIGWWCIFRGHDTLKSVQKGYKLIGSQFRRFPYRELREATGKFKEELGRGGSGTVYRGVLDDKRVVAVKKLTDVMQAEEEFWAEVNVIGRINHMNLVRMWGFCSEGRHRLLVYEYVQNQSLDKYLFADGGGGGAVLPWNHRFKIAVGTARGLAYLHHECLEWVIHCDVKPENILLDREFEAKIADFGLAKLSKRDTAGFNVSRVRGTKGYMAPEWALNSPITAKVDVYSYGVVLLELLKGSRVSDWAAVDGVEQDVRSRVAVLKEQLDGNGRSWVRDVVDHRLNGEFNYAQAAAMFHQYQVVGRALPSSTDEHPKIYRMKLWATNEVRAKSKFW